MCRRGLILLLFLSTFILTLAQQSWAQSFTLEQGLDTLPNQSVIVGEDDTGRHSPSPLSNVPVNGAARRLGE